MSFVQWTMFPACLLFVSSSVAQVTVTYNREAEIRALIGKCETCHGESGASPRTGIPVLAGRPASEIEDILQQFKHYERYCRKHEVYAPPGETPVNLTMCNVAGELSPDEMRDVSRYFADQPIPAQEED